MKYIEVIKEARLFIVLILTISGTSIINWDKSLEYIYAYNVHLALITIIGIYINHFLSMRRHKAAEVRMDTHSEIQTELQDQIKDIILDGNRSQIKAEVRQAFKDYHEIEVIDFITTIKYLRALDERRVSLGINSYTEDMMKILLAKITLK